MHRLVLAALLATACRTPDGPSGQGGARFEPRVAETPVVPLTSLFDVCWPPEATPDQRVVLIPRNGDVTFEVEGAGNAVGWCLREIVTTVPTKLRPVERLEVRPPGRPVDLWAALAWVKLLAPERFGPERGILDPAPLAAACLDRGPRPSLVRVAHSPLLSVEGLGPAESERCLEAVLGSTAWPSPRPLTVRVGPPPPGLAAHSAVVHAFAPEGERGPPLDPQLVRETMRAASGRVAACWNEALVRRAGLGGARTFRFRTDEAGRVVAAWTAVGLADGPVASDHLLDVCLAGVLKQLRVPGGPGEGVYTWVFASR